MDIVADLIDEVVRNIGSAETHKAVTKKVADLCGGFPLYKEMA